VAIRRTTRELSIADKKERISLMFLPMWIWLEVCQLGTAALALLVLASLVTAAVTNAEIIIRVKIISPASSTAPAPPTPAAIAAADSVAAATTGGTAGPSSLPQSSQQPQQLHDRQQQQGSNHDTTTATNTMDAAASSNSSSNNNNNSSSNNNNIRCISRTCTILRVGEDFLIMLLTGLVSLYFMLFVLSDIITIPKATHIVEFVVMKIL
jgi:hypothetical protein